MHAALQNNLKGCHAMVDCVPTRLSSVGSGARDATIGSASIGHEDRAEDREPIIAQVLVRPKQHSAQTIHLTDLSRHGCRLALEGVTLRVGEFISLKFGGLEYLQGIVRWVDADNAGIEFARPLHAAVLDNVLQNNLQ
jgi:hypothetical protein